MGALSKKFNSYCISQRHDVCHRSTAIDINGRSCRTYIVQRDITSCLLFAVQKFTLGLFRRTNYLKLVTFFLRYIHRERVIVVLLTIASNIMKMIRIQLRDSNTVFERTVSWLNWIENFRKESLFFFHKLEMSISGVEILAICHSRVMVAWSFENKGTTIRSTCLENKV